MIQISIGSDKAHTSFNPELCKFHGDCICVKTCPKKALSIDSAAGSVVVNHDICNRCRMCVIVCKHHGISVRKDKNGSDMIRICDLCGAN